MAKIINRYVEGSEGTLGSFSRYQHLFRLENDQGELYQETPERMVIPPDASDSFYLVEKGYEHRLDLISHKFYSTPLLWWVLAEINGLDNPLLVEAGSVLRVPRLSRVYGQRGFLL